MKRHRLSRKLGHFAMKPLEDATDAVKRMAEKNPLAAAGALGAGAGALAAGMGVGTAALLGGASAAFAVKLAKK